MTIRYLPAAQRALRKHRNMAAWIMAKVDDLAARPDALAGSVKQIQGRPEKRLRVGDFRVLYVEEGADILGDRHRAA